METTLIKKDTINRNPYLMIRVTPEEACSLIQSLAAQLQYHNPNKNRLESLAHGDINGYVSICVAHPDHCIQCGKKVEPFTGKLEKGGLICDNHSSHKEIGEKALQRRLNKAWSVKDPKRKYR